MTILPLNPPVPIEAWDYEDGPSYSIVAFGVVLNDEGEPMGVIAERRGQFELVTHYQFEWRTPVELELST